MILGFQRLCKKRLLKKLQENGEKNAGNQHFLLCPQCVLPFQRKNYTILKLLSSNTSNFTRLKFRCLVKGKGFFFPLPLERIELANQKLTIQSPYSSYSYIYQWISSKQLLQVSHRHGLNYTKSYLLYVIFFIYSSCRGNSQSSEYVCEGDLLPEYHLFNWFPSRSVNNAEYFVHSA